MTSRHLLFDIDVDALRQIVEQVGATQHQYRLAYSRALKRTASKIRQQSSALLKSGLAPRKMKELQRRFFARRIKRGAGLDEMSFWFGLNAIKVTRLRGRSVGKIPPRHRRRDKRTGRFIPAAQRRQYVARFEPKGQRLLSQSYPYGVVGRTRQGQRTIKVRDPLTRRWREALIDIAPALHDHLEDTLFAECVAVFMKEFESDIRRRVKHNITVKPTSSGGY
ncbi:hypothetical protein NVI2019_PEGOAJLN_01215 [Providencia alcalifaciens]|uniref:Phage tail protein n=1 Tax=Providencia alcalifaciens 205/92 TaxID=1256988 RepID=A0AAV3M9I1_9GAMM|nr:hypothetical protein [Providencia alcalifaciens]ETT05797.1 hypothetical protein HMPREF1562_1915 [Providencia alcalifaciens F90-2004]EUC96297.1 hypothetical protein HMPREF1567_2352 [Providencia alcalifaciens PAL-2]EUD00431.1 hypothetical protein HMPREF1566_1690 [Providencia alcalifaciens PAL-1]EUD12407.1 hypothetical protein HMPREF1563_2835 [Providencia alcalifaciens 205/92]MTB33287.1 hypothetical protein [Providencia alcalifaciens]